ncbi:symmetrical bis(5'-nucleosyl)-tetraphosphatase [Kushneria aurantia]|uniref:bis(5'-nucleosyl)-tetraphosphatase (symmetrical) n=1 Tax=Kushneria aurantia TaxID=504092 RepID=A0ABV6G6T8_9GAMM|nr:symmetrical bis(5'-nucleosyl)-tetraphosphatase [Kushneria aurantia]
MTTWAIGDLHGCLREFETLLERIDFTPGRDRLWIVGDIANRGPEPLETLRRVYALREHAEVVLGNHDLHMLAVAYGHGKAKRSDTLASILAAADRDELLEWLRRRPLLVTNDDATVVMTHAGLPPQWSVREAGGYAREAEMVLGGAAFFDFLPQLYGNTPARFEPQLEGDDRLRAIINVFTRMRFINADGELDFAAKEGLDTAPNDFYPWFCFRRPDSARLVFGHWAALEGQTPGARAAVYATDTGCVWGGALSALAIDSGRWVRVPSRKPRRE